MFYEVRCGNLIQPGTQYMHFEKQPEPGEDVFIGDIHFGVYELRVENGRPVVELFAW